MLERSLYDEASKTISELSTSRRLSSRCRIENPSGTLLSRLVFMAARIVSFADENSVAPDAMPDRFMPLTNVTRESCESFARPSSRHPGTSNRTVIPFVAKVTPARSLLATFTAIVPAFTCRAGGSDAPIARTPLPSLYDVLPSS